MSQYTDANDNVTTSECGVAACADSYLGDLAKSLNTLDDPLTGCSSGVKVMCGGGLMFWELKYFRFRITYWRKTY